MCHACWDENCWHSLDVPIRNSPTSYLHSPSFIYLYITTVGKGVQCQYQLLDLTPVHYRKYYFPGIYVFLSLCPVALEAQEKNCFTCGLVIVKANDRGDKKGQIWPQSNPSHSWPVLVPFSYLGIVQAPQSPFPSSLLLLLTPLLSQLCELCMQLWARSHHLHLNSLSC